MFKSVFYISLCATFFGNFVAAEEEGTSWIAFMKQMKHGLNYCLVMSSDSKWTCIKSVTLKGFDEIMTKDVIPLTNGIRLVRQSSASKPRNSLVNKYFDRWIRKHSTDSWANKVLMKFIKVFTSHVLQIDGAQSEMDSEARGRRRRSQMLPAMMFGITALGMVIVPIGFQFLAVVSGKALLLAKLALILASINGLKRIATSGVNFGLYQVPAEHIQYYDREDINPIRYKERDTLIN